MTIFAKLKSFHPMKKFSVLIFISFFILYKNAFAQFKSEYNYLSFSAGIINGIASSHQKEILQFLLIPEIILKNLFLKNDFIFRIKYHLTAEFFIIMT